MQIEIKYKKLLDRYGIETNENLTELLIAIDEKITDIGFDSEYFLNKDGMILQKLYDKLYEKGKNN